jgi:hypothetical protein
MNLRKFKAIVKVCKLNNDLTKVLYNEIVEIMTDEVKDFMWEWYFHDLMWKIVWEDIDIYDVDLDSIYKESLERKYWSHQR